MAASRTLIKPIWLRPLTVGTVALVHAAVLIEMPWPDAPELAVAAPLIVQVVPMGQVAVAVEAPQQAQVAEATEIVPQPVDAQPSPARQVEEASDPARVVKAIETPVPTETAVATREVPQENEKEERKKAAEKPRKKPDRKDNERSAANAPSRASAVARQSQARAVTGGVASANYRSIVSAELNRRKFYPPAARASGARGTVVVSFTVGSGGRVTRHAITRSSGQPALDQAVHRMMASVSLPPPPGGVFRATVPIRFDISR